MKREYEDQRERLLLGGGIDYINNINNTNQQNSVYWKGRLNSRYKCTIKIVQPALEEDIIREQKLNEDDLFDNNDEEDQIRTNKRKKKDSIQSLLQRNVWKVSKTKKNKDKKEKDKQINKQRSKEERKAEKMQTWVEQELGSEDSDDEEEKEQKREIEKERERKLLSKEKLQNDGNEKDINKIQQQLSKRWMRLKEKISKREKLKELFNKRIMIICESSQDKTPYAAERQAVRKAISSFFRQSPLCDYLPSNSRAVITNILMKEQEREKRKKQSEKIQKNKETQETANELDEKGSKQHEMIQDIEQEKQKEEEVEEEEDDEDKPFEFAQSEMNDQDSINPFPIEITINDIEQMMKECEVVIKWEAQTGLEEEEEENGD
ncbi:MAG: hypothetical protein EZS28_013596 [Streblomastix strix]|uniref:Uncharacterized protein n=1 Tax=Streblomastix strix TaxID=222440 RepID=A0A5J4W7N8_9EUKA|nr:MAG: hypothetical protein EZS28_013596 [Streblomastix strix]